MRENCDINAVKCPPNPEKDILTKDLIQAVHSIENSFIDQSVTLQNDLKLNQETTNQVLKLVHELNSKIEKLENKENNNKILEERIERLEQKVDQILSVKLDSESVVTELTGKCQTIENKIDTLLSKKDLSLTSAIIDLSKNVSGLEKRFDNYDSSINEQKSHKIQDLDNDNDTEFRSDTNEKNLLMSIQKMKINS